MDRKQAVSLLKEVEKYANSVARSGGSSSDSVSSFFMDMFEKVASEVRQNQWISEDAYLTVANLKPFLNEQTKDICVTGCASTVLITMLSGSNYGGTGLFVNLHQASEVLAKILGHFDSSLWGKSNYFDAGDYFKHLLYKSAEDMLQKGWISEAAYAMVVNLEPYFTGDAEELVIVGAATFILRRFVEEEQRNPGKTDENIYPNIKLAHTVLSQSQRFAAWYKKRGYKTADAITYFTSILTTSADEAKLRSWIDEATYDKITSIDNNFNGTGNPFDALEAATATFLRCLDDIQRKTNRETRQERRGRDSSRSKGFGNLGGMFNQMRDQFFGDWLEEMKEEIKNELKDELKDEIMGELGTELKQEIMDELKDEIIEELKTELE